MKDRRKYGVIGRHISHSLSPELHGIFARYTRSYDYERLDLEEHELEGVIRNTEYSGFNVTSPYKRTVIPFLDELTPEAEALQAVNTIRRLGNGAWWGTIRMCTVSRSWRRRNGFEAGRFWCWEPEGHPPPSVRPSGIWGRKKLFGCPGTGGRNRTAAPTTS